MKVKIVINTVIIDANGPENIERQTTSEVWSGELELFNDKEYLTKISIIAEGKEHPICDVPFSPDMTPGYWMYMGRSNANDESGSYVNEEQIEWPEV